MDVQRIVADIWADDEERDDQEARAGIFRDDQMVRLGKDPDIPTGGHWIVLRMFLDSDSCRRRLDLIAEDSAYDVERAWLKNRLARLGN